YWPRSQFAQLEARWPDLVEGYGGTPEAHRDQTESELRDYTSLGGRVSVVHADAEALAEYADEHGLDPTQSQTRARFAAVLAQRGHALSWPPGRNERCWCGSGKKYKQCCGAVR